MNEFYEGVILKDRFIPYDESIDGESHHYINEREVPWLDFIDALERWGLTLDKHRVDYFDLQREEEGENRFLGHFSANDVVKAKYIMKEESVQLKKESVFFALKRWASSKWYGRRVVKRNET